jgi:hypothetical protein
MTNGLDFDRKTGEVVRTPPKSTTTPWEGIGWLVFCILLAISPALVWAAWTALL